MAELWDELTDDEGTEDKDQVTEEPELDMYGEPILKDVTEDEGGEQEQGAEPDNGEPDEAPLSERLARIDDLLGLARPEHEAEEETDVRT